MCARDRERNVKEVLYKGCRNAAAESGYTLLDMMAALAIAAVTGAMAVSQVNLDPLRLAQASVAISGELRMARSKALSTGVHFSVKLSNKNGAARYVIRHMRPELDDNGIPTGDWVALGGDAGLWRKATLADNLQWGHWPKDGNGRKIRELEFDTRGLAVNIDAPVTYQLEDKSSGKSRTFTVWPSGQVKTDLASSEDEGDD